MDAQQEIVDQYDEESRKEMETQGTVQNAVDVVKEDVITSEDGNKEGKEQQEKSDTKKVVEDKLFGVGASLLSNRASHHNNPKVSKILLTPLNLVPVRWNGISPRAVPSAFVANPPDEGIRVALSSPSTPRSRIDDDDGDGVRGDFGGGNAASSRNWPRPFLRGFSEGTMEVMRVRIHEAAVSAFLADAEEQKRNSTRNDSNISLEEQQHMVSEMLEKLCKNDEEDEEEEAAVSNEDTNNGDSNSNNNNNNNNTTTRVKRGELGRARSQPSLFDAEQELKRGRIAERERELLLWMIHRQGQGLKDVPLPYPFSHNTADTTSSVHQHHNNNNTNTNSNSDDHVSSIYALKDEIVKKLQIALLKAKVVHQESSAHFMSLVHRTIDFSDALVKTRELLEAAQAKLEKKMAKQQQQQQDEEKQQQINK